MNNRLGRLSDRLRWLKAWIKISEGGLKVSKILLTSDSNRVGVGEANMLTQKRANLTLFGVGIRGRKGELFPCFNSFNQ